MLRLFVCATSMVLADIHLPKPHIPQSIKIAVSRMPKKPFAIAIDSDKTTLSERCGRPYDDVMLLVKQE